MKMNYRVIACLAVFVPANLFAQDPIEKLRQHLNQEPTQPLEQESFAHQPLKKAQAAAAEDILWQVHAKRIRRDRHAELEAKEIAVGKHKLPIWYKMFGEKPKEGHSLWISMHGGGGTAPPVNDRQWHNQKRLYTPEEGIYLAPRAPTNTWNLWHQAHIDQLYDRLIETFIVLKDVNPNRVYILGYSAGGDGVYQLAPRMADRWAAAAMMAGHPNDASPLGLRNIGFALFMGGRDSAYNRNGVAEQWKEQLEALHQTDPTGYRHQVTIYPDKGHWMGGQDKVALPWMAKFTRNPNPSKIVWQQDDVTRRRSYWLATKTPKPKSRIVVTLSNQQIDVENHSFESDLQIRLNDSMLDLDKNVEIYVDDKLRYSGLPQRTINTIAKTLSEYGDPSGVYTTEINVNLKSENNFP